VPLFPRPFAAVIFDLDGTLVHSAPDIAAALNIILKAEGVPTFASEDTYRFIGRGAERLIADAFAARGRVLAADALAALTQRYLAAYAHRGSPDTTLYPGAMDMLCGLRSRGIKLAICTNKAQSLSNQVVAGLGLNSVIASVIGSDSGYGRKPAPEPLLEACRRIGVEAQEALMVGDTITDVRTAAAAMCASAVVRHGYSQQPIDALGAQVVLDSVADVTNLIAP
jgi:phosphoglycolate phosphatase